MVVVGHRRLLLVVPHGDSHLKSLGDVLGRDSTDDHRPLVQDFRAFGAGSDEYPCEVEHRRLLAQRPAVTEYTVGVHLQLVVVQKAERLEALHQRMELEASLLDELPAPGVRAVDHRHLVELGHVVDGGHQRHEVLLVVYVLLPVGRDQDVPVLLKLQPLQHIALQDAFHVAVQHLAHGRTGDEEGLAVQALGKQVPSGMLGVRHVDVADVVHDLAVDHLAHVPVPAAVARLHVEDGHLQALGADGRQCTVGIAQHQKGIGLLLLDNLVALCDDVSHRLAQVLSDAVQVVVGGPQPQVLEEHLVERIVPVLSRMHQYVVEVRVALLYHCTEPYDLGPSTQYCHHLHLFHAAHTFSNIVSGLSGLYGSLAHMKVTKSPSPSLMMLWV